MQFFSEPPEYAQDRHDALILISQVSEDLRWLLVLRSPGEQAALDRKPWPPPIVRVLVHSPDQQSTELHPYLTCVPVGEPREVDGGGYEDWRRALRSTPRGEEPNVGRPRTLSPNEIAESDEFALEYSYSIVVGPTQGYESEEYGYYEPGGHHGDLEILWRGERARTTISILPPSTSQMIRSTWLESTGILHCYGHLNYRTTPDRISFELLDEGLAIETEVLSNLLRDGRRLDVSLKPTYWPLRDPVLKVWITLDSGEVVTLTTSP